MQIYLKIDKTERFDAVVITVNAQKIRYLSAVPFLFDDAWDSFNFDTDVANWTKYQVNGERTIELVNNGDITITPIITVKGAT